MVLNAGTTIGDYSDYSGTMFPMRVRLTDEEGATQTYTIKEYS